MNNITEQQKLMKFVSSPYGKSSLRSIDDCTDTEIFIPATYNNTTVKNISPRVFYKRSDITSVHLPDSLEVIGACAFEGCKSIRTIRIPKSVNYFCYEAFVACENLATVEIEDLTAWCNAYFENEDSNPLHNGAALCIDGKPIKHLVIPSGLESTGYATFSGCTSITKATVPGDVKIVSAYTFSECENLELAVLSEGIEWIRAYAFRSCESLTDITLPQTLVRIDECAFYNCPSLREIVLPDGVTELPDLAFHSCAALRSVTLGKNISKIGALAFAECGSLEKIIFKGSAAEWNAIEKYDKWDAKTGDYSVFCNDAVIGKSETN